MFGLFSSDFASALANCARATDHHDLLYAVIECRLHDPTGWRLLGHTRGEDNKRKFKDERTCSDWKKENFKITVDQLQEGESLENLRLQFRARMWGKLDALLVRDGVFLDDLRINWIEI